MRRLTHALVPAVLAAGLLALSACGTPATPPTGTESAQNVVSLRDEAFDPRSLTVRTGETVTFTNDDQVSHDIVVGTEELGSQGAGETRTWTATRDGTFEMRCTIHPSMTGEIVVGEGRTEEASPATSPEGGGGTGGSKETSPQDGGGTGGGTDGPGGSPPTY